MSGHDFIPKVSLLGEQYKDNSKKTFSEIFIPEYSNRIIMFLRGKGFFVTTFFDYTGRRRILATTLPLIKHNSDDIHNGVIMNGDWLEIEITVNNHPLSNKELNRKKQIQKSNGIYLTVSSFPQFVESFNQIERTKS